MTNKAIQKSLSPELLTKEAEQDYLKITRNVFNAF